MRLLKNIMQIIKMPLEASPVITVEVFMLKLIQGVMPVIKLFIMAHLLDNLLSFISAEENISVLYFSAFFLSILIEKMNRNFENYVSVNLRNKIWEKSTKYLVSSWANTKYELVEDESNFAMFTRIKNRADEQIYKNYINLINFLSLVINIIAIIVYIFSYSLFAGVGMIFLLFILIITSIYGGRTEYHASVNAQKAKIETNYFNDVLTNKNAANERIIFSYEKDVSGLWEKSYFQSCNAELNAEKALLQQYQLVGIMGTCISIIMIFLFSTMLNCQSISYGVFTALAANIVSLTKDISSSVNLQIRNIVKAIHYVNDYNKITQLSKEQFPVTTKIDFKKIEIKNLKYKYNNGKYVLNGLNMIIDHGKSYALIGENGAGKTTLIKLLVGLYRNYEGNILVDGKELKDNPGYYTLFGAIFQDYAKYNMSLRDNLILGRKEKIGDEQILNTLFRYGLSYLKNNLKKGLDTLLGNQFQDSIDLSGGEWQKVALARLELSESIVKIYDEPTSSLDPLSESKIYSLLSKYQSNNTYFIISHRLGVTTLVDHVFVLADGIICEEGSHVDLLKNSSIYRRMFDEQKAWYMI